MPRNEKPRYRGYPKAFIGALGVILVFVIVSLLLILLRIIFAPRKWQNTLIEKSANLLNFFLGIEVKVTNKEIYNSKEACLIISNHSSLIDIPITYAAASGCLRMLGKIELLLIPFLGWGMLASHFVAVRRGNRSSGEKALNKITQRLKLGFQFYMAPEGTRSPRGKLLPFKTGAFRIALKTNTPIVVLALEKPWELLPKGKLLPLYGGIVHATFLGKIDPQNFLKEESNTLQPSNGSEKSIQNMIQNARKLFIDHGLTES